MNEMISNLQIIFITILGSVIPIYLGLMFFSENIKINKIKNYVSVGILAIIFFDLMEQTAGLGLETTNSIIRIILVFTFSVGLLIPAYYMGYINSVKKHFEEKDIYIVYIWAIAIGVHGIAEGMIIGKEYISGFLSLTPNQLSSFALHKVFEGMTIASLITNQINRRKIFTLSLISGLPIGLGTILGIFNVSSLIPLYLFSVGAGSTVYIFIQLSKRVTFDVSKPSGYLWVLIGIFMMYIAGLLHQF